MLTTLERAKPMLGIPLDDTSEDGQLLLALLTASERIENECRRSFKKQQYMEKRSGLGSTFFPLNNYPIHSVTKVTVSGREVNDFTEVDGILHRPCGWPRGEFNLEATYIGGYVLPEDETSDQPATLPKPLEYACILFVQTLLRTPGISTERVGDLSVTYANEGEGLPFAVKSLISPYIGRWV